MDHCTGTHQVRGTDGQTSEPGLWPHLYPVIREVQDLIRPGYGSRKEVSEKLIIFFLA